MYAYPSDLNITGWTGLLIWSNQVTNYWFGNLILFAIFLIMLITLLNTYDSSKAFVVSSFITTIIALLFRGIGIIGELPLLIGIICTAIGFIIAGKN